MSEPPSCSTPEPDEAPSIELKGRTCYSCRRTLPSAAFSIHRVKSGAFYNRRCNQCRSKRQQASKAVLEKKALIDAVKSQPCTDCKRTFPTLAMDLDHVRGTKRFNLSSGWRYKTMEDLVAELAKCEPVCVCCHRIRTSARKQFTGRKPRLAYVDLAELPSDTRSEDAAA